MIRWETCAAGISKVSSPAAMESVLEKKKIEILEVYAELDKSKGMIYFSYKYKIDTNCILFQSSQIVEIVDEMGSYGF